MGCNLGPLVNSMLHFYPDIVITAIMATCTIFACFSAGALMAKRREFRESAMPKSKPRTCYARFDVWVLFSCKYKVNKSIDLVFCQLSGAF
jgi:hypothetical protein